MRNLSKAQFALMQKEAHRQYSAQCEAVAAKVYRLWGKHPSSVVPLSGSGEHRTARALDAKGYGIYMACQPYEGHFFAIGIRRQDKL